jgi:site-specific recombinase XerC
LAHLLKTLLRDYTRLHIITHDNAGCRANVLSVTEITISGALSVYEADAAGQGSGQRAAPAFTPAQLELRRMVLEAVVSPHTRRNYGKALDDLFTLAAGRPLRRALLMEYRAAMEGLSPSTINVRLSAVRKMVSEARKNGMLGAEEAANLTEVPNIPQKGTRLGNWLTREQARELLAVPDRATLKGKRDYVLLAMLVGCALRREELAVLDVERAPGAHRGDSGLGEAGNQHLDDRRGRRRRQTASRCDQRRQGQGEHERLGRLVGGRAICQRDRDRAIRGS